MNLLLDDWQINLKFINNNFLYIQKNEQIVSIQRNYKSQYQIIKISRKTQIMRRFQKVQLEEVLTSLSLQQIQCLVSTNDKYFQQKKKYKKAIKNTHYPYFHNIYKYYSNLRQVFNKLKAGSSLIYLNGIYQFTYQMQIYCVQFCKNFHQLICIGNGDYLNQKENYLKIGKFCLNLQKSKNNISKRVFANLLNIHQSSQSFQSMFNICLTVNYQKYKNKMFFALLLQQKGLIKQVYYRQIVFNENYLPKITKQNFYQIKFLNLQRLILENVRSYQFLWYLNVNDTELKLKIYQINQNSDIFRTLSKFSQMKDFVIQIMFGGGTLSYTQQKQQGKQVWDIINFSKLKINDNKNFIARFQGLKINEVQIMKKQIDMKYLQSDCNRCSDYFLSKIMKYQNNSQIINKKINKKSLNPFLPILE